MKVHLIKEKTIRAFVVRHSGSKISFEEWLSKTRFADWNEPDDIKSTFPSVDFLGGGSYRAVFDIAGNRYRMICKYYFGETNVRLYICWIGTHADYDKLCSRGEQFTVFDY